MIRIVLLCVLAVPVLYILLLTVSALAVDGKREYLKHSRYYRRLLDSGVVLAKFLCRLKISHSGTERIPEGRFLLVSNHRSNFDPIVTWYVLRDRDIAFISKDKNFSIPWFGRFIRRCCCLAIDRENPRNAILTIQKAADLMKDDQVSVGVYPEGTRSKTGELLPFHNGVFKIAQRAGVPVVVAAVSGTHTIHENWPLRRSSVSVDIIDIIPAEEVKARRTSELGERIFNELREKLSEEAANETVHSV